MRVAGPFTVESLSPHRVMGVDENDELLDSHRVCLLAFAETSRITFRGHGSRGLGCCAPNRASRRPRPGASTR